MNDEQSQDFVFYSLFCSALLFCALALYMQIESNINRADLLNSQAKELQQRFKLEGE